MPRGQGQRGNISDRIDRDLLHEYLWEHSDHNGRFTQSQKELAEGLAVTQFTMSTIFHEMCVEGRLRKVKWNFFVTDPTIWRWKNPPPTMHPSPPPTMHHPHVEQPSML